MSDTKNNAKSQLDKFKEAARELECDDDESRFLDRVGKLMKSQPDSTEGR